MEYCLSLVYVVVMQNVTESCTSPDLPITHLTVPISVFSVPGKIVVTGAKDNTRALYLILATHLFFDIFFSFV